MKLPEFTLTYNDEQKRWELTNDQTNRTVRTFQTKAAATAGGVLQTAIGGEGSVTIQKINGRIEEERTFPRSNDPRRSRG